MLSAGAGASPEAMPLDVVPALAARSGAVPPLPAAGPVDDPLVEDGVSCAVGALTATVSGATVSVAGAVVTVAGDVVDSTVVVVVLLDPPVTVVAVVAGAIVSDGVAVTVV